MEYTASPRTAPVLPQLGVLRFAGRDAAAFLQGQLTNDTRLLADGRTQLSACSTPQGRVIALLRLRQHGEEILALLPAELAGPVVAQLRRYVLRAKVAIEVAADLELRWLDAPGPLEGGELTAFDWGGGRTVITVPAAVTAQQGAPRSAAEVVRDWNAADIAAGLPQVHAAASGAFVPQMLNLDLLDAISFTKGCYTGQEIVARTQHLGRIKRRTFRYGLPPGPEPAPLAGLYLDGTKVAEVLTSAAHDGGVELLAVTSLEARDAVLTAEDGRRAEPRPLPYRVADGR